jgi:opacity protein-like surface antigen
VRFVGLGILLVVCAVPRGVAAQDAEAPMQDHAPPATSPAIHMQGFMDIDYVQSDDAKAIDGFTLGQFAGHLIARLGNKVTFFGEASVTASETGFTVELERAILRYDYNDHFKISLGKYHTPINYWNIAYHHGLWLQTTVARPEMVRVGGTFEPVHFVGLLAEGTLSSPALGLNYNVGFGNGRSTLIGRAGDAGDVNRNRAWLARLYARPASAPGVEFGGSVYHDLVPNAGSGVPELITSAYIAVTSERPEIIAEFADVRHHDPTTQLDYHSKGGYVQAAYRLPNAPRWKPYARFDKLSADEGEPVFGPLDTRIFSSGLRFELSDQAAIKAEYRWTRHFGDPRGINALYLQAAFTF